MKLESSEEWESQITSDDHDLLASCGIPFAKLENKKAIVDAVTRNSCIFSVKAEMDQIREGKELFKITSLFTKYPNLFMQLLTYSVTRNTAKSFEDLFHITFSPMGSNAREMEEKSAMHWTTFIEEVEEGLLSDHSADNIITLDDVLFFVTGAKTVPLLGLTPSPTITFRFDCRLPQASTCANALDIPITDSYEECKENMCFAISNTVGFGTI